MYFRSSLLLALSSSVFLNQAHAACPKLELTALTSCQTKPGDTPCKDLIWENKDGCGEVNIELTGTFTSDPAFTVGKLEVYFDTDEKQPDNNLNKEVTPQGTDITFKVNKVDTCSPPQSVRLEIKVPTSNADDASEESCDVTVDGSVAGGSIREFITGNAPPSPPSGSPPSPPSGSPPSPPSGSPPSGSPPSDSPPSGSPPTGGSGEGGEQGGKRRRRMSESATTLDPKDQLFKVHMDMCGLHEYDVFLFIDQSPHMYGVGKASKEAEKAGCPHVATHAITQDNSDYVKEILTWENKADFEHMFPMEDAHHVGSFKLAELEQAFQKIDVSSNGGYNVVTNNCGSYMVKLAAELGVKPDAAMMSFVTRRLVEYSTKDLMNNIRASLFGGKRSLRASDEQIVELLVQDGVSDLL